MCLSSSRQREVWAMLSAKHRSNDLVADVSQSIRRAHPHFKHAPTVTPRGRICVQKLGRLMTPLEKLLVHGFPLHKIKLPASLTDEAVNLLGGNTMHLKAIGLILLIGVSLLKSNVPCPPLSGRLPPVGRPVFVVLGAGQRRKRPSAATRQRPTKQRRVADR